MKTIATEKWRQIRPFIVLVFFPQICILANEESECTVYVKETLDLQSESGQLITKEQSPNIEWFIISEWETYNISADEFIPRNSVPRKIAKLSLSCSIVFIFQSSNPQQLKKDYKHIFERHFYFFGNVFVHVYKKLVKTINDVTFILNASRR